MGAVTTTDKTSALQAERREKIAAEIFDKLEKITICAATKALIKVDAILSGRGSLFKQETPEAVYSVSSLAEYNKYLSSTVAGIEGMGDRVKEGGKRIITGDEKSSGEKSKVYVIRYPNHVGSRFQKLLNEVVVVHNTDPDLAKVYVVVLRKHLSSPEDLKGVGPSKSAKLSIVYKGQCSMRKIDTAFASSEP